MTELKSQVSYNWSLNELLNGHWNKTYKIDQNAPFYFRIADNSTLTNNIRRNIKDDEFVQSIFTEQLNFIPRQSETKLWIKLEENIVQLTLLDVYHSFLKYLKDRSFEDQLFNVNEVSFMGPLGPFSELSLVDCLNDRIADSFIFSNIIQAKIPSRKMRVHTQGNVKVSFDNDFAQSGMLGIKQITDSGILLSTKDEFLVEDLSKSEVLKFHMDSSYLKDFVDNNLSSNKEVNDFFYSENELRYFFIEETKIQKSLSYKSTQTNEFFLFCRYHDMLESDIPNIFMEFIKKLEDYFLYLDRA